MRTKIQIALSNESYRNALGRMLRSSDSSEVLYTEEPNVNPDAVLVVDFHHLDRLPSPIPRPERVVLVIDEASDHVHQALANAWDLGVHSVIYCSDSLPTAVLAILSAKLRTTRSLPGKVIGE